MRPAVTTPTETRFSPPLPLANVADVALINAKTCAAIGSMSVSWWHDEVRAGRAPAPATRRPRCTRWRVADVRAFWQRFAETGNDSQQVIAQATKASKAAKVKREAVRGGQ